MRGMVDKKLKGMLSRRPKAEAWGAWQGGWAPGQCHYSGDEDCMNDLRKSRGQQECSPAGCTHGISLRSNSHPEQPIIKKKPGEGFLPHADAERGTVTFTQTCESCTEFTIFTGSPELVNHLHVPCWLTYFIYTVEIVSLCHNDALRSPLEITKKKWIVTLDRTLTAKTLWCILLPVQINLFISCSISLFFAYPLLLRHRVASLPIAFDNSMCEWPPTEGDPAASCGPMC